MTVTSSSERHVSDPGLRVGFAIAALLVALAAPSTLHAACRCEMTSRAGEAKARPWSERDRIFIGEVLDADSLPDARRKSVTFVTEMSWRGETPDTVTLVLDDTDRCVYYRAGGRYFVAADLRSPEGTTLLASRCDGSWRADSPGALKMIAELGPPVWQIG